MINLQYRTDPAPSDYYVFLTLQNFLSNKKQASREYFKNVLQEFFANRDQGLLEKGIMKILSK